MATLGDLVVNLKANKSGLAKDLQSGRSMLGSYVASAGKLLGGIGAGVGAALGVKSSIEAARTQATEEKKLAAVIKATGGAAGLTAGQIGEMASELQSVTNFGDEVTLSAASIAATFKNIKGDTFKEAIALSQDLATVLGTDLNTATMQVSKALDDPSRGFAALRKSGVSFTQDEIKRIQTMQKSGDMAGAQGVILAALAGQVKGAAKAAADPLTQFWNLIGDIGENIGFLFLPALNELASGFGDVFGPVQGATGAFKAVGEWIAGGVRTVKDFIAANIETIKTIGRVIAIAATVVGTIAAVAGAFSLVGPAASAAFALVLAATGPVGLAIAAVTAGIVLLTGEGETMGEKINSTFSQIPDLIDGLAFTFRNFSAIAQIALIDIGLAALEMFPMIQGPVEQMIALIAGLWSGAKAGFQAFLENVKGGLTEIVNVFKALVDGAKAAFDAIKSGNLSGAAGAFGEAFTKTLASQANAKGGGNPFTAFQNAFDQTRQQVSQGFADKGLVDQLQQAKDSLLNDIATSENTAIAKISADAQALQPDIQTPAGTAVETKAVGSTAAVQRGSQEAFAAIQRAIQGGKDPNKKLESIGQKQITVQERMADQLERVADAVGEEDDEFVRF